MIDNLIFNELASHRPVALPRAGVLRVVRRSAHIEDGAMVPPRNLVVYSAVFDAPTTLQLPDYDAWLASASVSGDLVIDGVGRITMGEFVIDEQLDAALNGGGSASETRRTPPAPQWQPSPPQWEPANYAAKAEWQSANSSPAEPKHHTPPYTPHTSEKMDNRMSPDYSSGHYDRRPRERRGKSATNTLLIVALILMLALLAAIVCYVLPMRRDLAAMRAENQSLQTQVQQQAAQIEKLQTPPPVAAAASPEVPDVEKYHLIVGSFVEAEHAEKRAEYYRTHYPNLTVQVFGNGERRTYVSVFQSDSKRTAYTRFMKIAEQTGNWDDMWVWERP